MSIFGKKESCMVCNKLGAKVAIFNGFICKECYDKSYDYLSNSVDISQRRVREIEDAISKYFLNQEDLNEFNGNKKIGTYIEIDEENKMFQVLDSFGKRVKDAVVYRYGDITRFELVEDGFVINKGGLGQPPIENINGQTTNAFVNNLKLRLYSSNKNKGNKEIKIVASELNIHSNLYNSIYGTVKELMQFLESTINSENNSLESSSDDIDFSNELSTVDEILKIEGLLDSGVITQDEFDKIQSRILGF